MCNTIITPENVELLVSCLTDDEKQLLKDTIIYGAWGDTDMDFLDGDSKVVTDYAYGYCTNDAKKAGHFQGRKASVMFRSMYRKLCPANSNQIGDFLTHINNWWGDGTGDMLFIRAGYYQAFNQWAYNNI